MYQLRSYQKQAVEEALKSSFRYEMFDMGLGKTLIMLDYIKRSGRKALVIAPMLVATRTWPQEIRKWTNFSHVVLHGKDKGDLFKSKADIKVINYDGIKWFYEQTVLHGSVDLKDRVLILDEPTAIKSRRSLRFKKLAPFRHFFKNNGIFNLCATPMPNGYQDLWTQYFMIDGGKALYKTYQDYEDEFFIRNRYNQYEINLRPGADKIIQERVAPITSVLRAEDHIDMPEALYETRYVTLPSGVKAQYDYLKSNLLSEFGDQLQVVADSAGVLSGKLRQVTQGAIYHDEGTSMVKNRVYSNLHSAKIDMLKQLLAEANGNPILCPIYFSFEYEEIQKALGYEVPLIAGGVTEWQKQQYLDLWDTGNLPLLIVHPASVTHGLNMQTGGHTIVWYGMPWSLEQYTQLNGRLIRPGQKNPVRIIFIAAENTIDERVASVLSSKAATQSDFKNAILQEFQY